MVSQSVARCNAVDDFDGDVSFGDFDFDEAVPIADRTRTDARPPGVVIYPHGFSVRVRLLADKLAACAALDALGWKPGGGAGWKTYVPKSGRPRSILGGSAWLTHTAPRNLRLPLARLNRRCKTVLYALAVDELPEHLEMDLVGVRSGDIARLFEEVLGLGPADYAAVHYRQAERYVVLDRPTPVGLSVSIASYHLARLADAGVAVAIRRGRRRVYKWPATRCALAFVEAHPSDITAPGGAVLTDCVPSGDAAAPPEGPRLTPTQ